MKQNIYDNERFFINYQQMRQQKESSNRQLECPTIRSMIPVVDNCKAIDIGCGNGELSEYLASNGAASVLGVDISERMIKLAKRRSQKISEITYECCAFEDLILDECQYDLVVSSVAFHYVENFNFVCAKIAQSLKQGGYFIFSIEHPVLTANKTDWLLDINGQRKYNIVMDYFKEGKRQAEWLGAKVISYHRSFSSILNSLIKTGFLLEQIEEQGFLFIRARKDTESFQRASYS